MRKIIIPAVLGALLALSGCSGGSPEAVPTVTVTETVTAVPSESSESADNNILHYDQLQADAERWSKYKLKYAASHNRQVLFRDYEIAKYVVARKLEAGFFGQPRRYNEYKVDYKPGMFGWGGVNFNAIGGGNMNKPSAYAWVWFRKDGSIDYSRGVTSMSIDAGPKYKGVMIFDQLDVFDPTPAQKKLKYQVALDQFGSRRGDIRDTCVSPSSICLEDGDGFNYTGDLNEMTQLDEDAIKELNRSMTALFGPNWRTM